MQTIIHSNELKQALAGLPKPIGFVPTMGYLHEGHLSLARKAHDECASVVASIFVNPTQFGPSEDLNRYPRSLSRDLSLLESAKVDLTWTPETDEMYPPGFQTWVSVENLATRLEGEQRPGHFRGVTTVVAKLFNSVQPQKAYFGQKDAQQVAVIQRMVHDLNFPIEIIVCPTARESDGLALSSRNSYLNPEERKAAPVLYRALLAAETAFVKGEKDAGILRQMVKDTVNSEPLAEIKYVSCADSLTLEEVDLIKRKTLLSLAVSIGKTRLIDNIEICG